jgi:hypothetical protein
MGYLSFLGPPTSLLLVFVLPHVRVDAGRPPCHVVWEPFTLTQEN